MNALLFFEWTSDDLRGSNPFNQILNFTLETRSEVIYTLTVTQPRPRQLKKVKTEHYVWTDILENRENQSLFCFVSEKKLHLNFKNVNFQY